MNRKKFIKQLQGVGITRNLAASLAATCQSKGLSYFKGLGLYLSTYAMLLHGQDPLCLYPAAGGGTL